MPTTTPDIAVSTHVDAPAEVVYDLIADLPRMGEWSPECTAVEWRKGATGPAVGARFVGRNRKGALRWSTNGEVVEADRGRSFAFEITAAGIKVARWGYRVEADADGPGCTVTEEWFDRRPPVFGTLTGLAMGVRDRGEHNRKGMEHTLAQLKAAAELATAS